MPARSNRARSSSIRGSARETHRAAATARMAMVSSRACSGVCFRRSTTGRMQTAHSAASFSSSMA